MGRHFMRANDDNLSDSAIILNVKVAECTLQRDSSVVRYKYYV